MATTATPTLPAGGETASATPAGLVPAAPPTPPLPPAPPAPPRPKSDLRPASSLLTWLRRTGPQRPTPPPAHAAASANSTPSSTAAPVATDTASADPATAGLNLAADLVKEIAAINQRMNTLEMIAAKIHEREVAAVASVWPCGGVARRLGAGGVWRLRPCQRWWWLWRLGRPWGSWYYWRGRRHGREAALGEGGCGGARGGGSTPDVGPA